MSGSNSPTSDRSVVHRLPYDVRPRRYDLHLAPDLGSATFSGDVVVKADATAEVSQIVLNALDLSISSASVTPSDGRVLPCDARLEKSSERVVLSLPEPLRTGPVEIAIAFSGVLNDDLRGFYRSTFTDSDGEPRTIAATQFEATDARRAFPCFDEPDRKAVFALTVDAPDGLAVFSNSPVVEQTPIEGGLVRRRFAPTISMSTYLVAIVVGPLEATEPLDVDGTPVRLVHVPGKGDLCEYALEVAAHALRFFSDWFGIPYPGEKLDLVAIPDFAFGAMENLGCVTFREVLLLIDPDRASRLELERVADVISHEIAHMWFGDLVTMKWWNGIWLNEAFASFMELLCVDDFRPQWMRWTSFGMERSAAMAVDALHSTRPVEYPVGPPEEAEGMFDVLTYQKGAGVLRMLEQYLGAARFRDGVREYLSTNLLSNTDTSDLWDAIERATGEPVREIMDSWIFQGGFPLVSATSRPEGVVLTQQPFSYSETDGPSAIGTSWKVPVITRLVGTAEGNSSRWLLGADTTTLELPRRGDGEALLVVNAGGSGYYRVHYEPGHLRRLSEAIASLDPLERSNVLDDVWASVLSAHSALDDFLVVAEALDGGERTEDDPDVWSRVTSVLSLLDHAVEDCTRQQLAAYARALVRPAFDRLGFAPRKGDDERTLGLRAQLLSILGTVGQDGQVRDECTRLQAEELAARGVLDPNLASAVAGVVAWSGSQVEFEEFLERYRHPGTPQEEARYRSALTGFPDPELAARAFDLALKEVRAQDTPYFVQLLLSSRENGAATWRRVREQWDELVGRVPSQTVPRMLDGVRLLCRDPVLAREIRDFLAAHPLRAGQRSVDQTLERQEVLVSLATRLEDDAESAFADGCERIAGH
jgi:aminopeptidase N